MPVPSLDKYRGRRKEKINMLNQSILVGRLVSKPQIFETKKGIKSSITLAVPRSYKNSEGVYETDFIPCVLWNNVAENTFNYCKKGDVIGIKGRVQSNSNQIEIIAEKVTFLSSQNAEQ